MPSVEPVTLSVHRCRFVDFNPSAITALAFPPLPLPSRKGKKPATAVKFGTLAVGHANGSIDLCEWTGEPNETQSSQAWVVRKTLPGLFPSKVDALAFSIRNPDEKADVPSLSNLRLFSSGGGPELLEWDLSTSRVRRTISSQGGCIWSIAVNPSSNKLALGCEDGTVRILDIANDALNHSRRFDRVKCRLLSICWGPPVPKLSSQQTDDESEEYEWSDSWLVTGGSDSSLRKWEVSSGRVLDRMGTDKQRGEKTLVWTVGVLGDGTIVSGDSLGMVKFWDSRTCTQLQSFQGHGADILCLAFGPDGTTVYSSGVDQRVSQFSLIKTSKANQAVPGAVQTSTRWVQTSSRRLHSHDVRALAMWPPYTAVPAAFKRQFPPDVAPILASGGLDMSVVVTPAALPSNVVKLINPLATSSEATFADSYHRRLAYVSGPSSTSGLHVARTARLLSCMRESGVTVWRILEKTSSSDEEDMQDRYQEDAQGGGWEKVLEMDFKVQTNLLASAISDDGRWLVVSDLYEAKLFLLSSNLDGTIKTRRIREFSSILKSHLPSQTGGVAFIFTPDSKKLIMSTALSSHVMIIDLSNEEQPHVLRRFDHHRQVDTFRRVLKTRTIPGNDGDVDMAEPEADASSDSDDEETVSNAKILRLTVSSDGQWLVTSDDQARTHVYNLDSIQHHCALPSFRHPVQALSFDPSNPNLLILAFPDNTFQIYDVEARHFPSWAKSLVSNLPKRLTHSHEPMLGVTFDPKTSESGRYALFWGSTWLCKIKLDSAGTGSSGSRKRRRAASQRGQLDGDEQHRDVKMITHYRPILHVDFLAGGELVVVERPLVDVLGTLPPAYFKHKYGSS
ncbi:WD40-repeat-containing domain protein [Mycena floridula]|nr:WD40-repeat-containing domain protein [Mycena floridula]